MIAKRLSVASLALASVLVVGGPAIAASNRVWVSGHGIDQPGCGAPTSPCRSLQYAHDSVVAAGGEIDILDPAGYGAITITKSISIVNDGVGTAGVQATSGNAVTIAAGASDAVYLKGLNIDGVQFAGVNGVELDSAGSLTVANCVIRHFAQNGIFLTPTAAGPVKLTILNTMSADNHNIGVLYLPPSGGAFATGTIDHLTAVNDGTGVLINGLNDHNFLYFTISNTIADNNSSRGIEVDDATAPLLVTIHDTDMSFNAQYGLYAVGQAQVSLSRSYIDANFNYGIFNGTASLIFSSGDNHSRYNINGDVSGPALQSELPE